MTPAEPRPPLTVACLCAAWCGTCTAYRAVFDALAAEVGAGARFVWVDIEDEADLMGNVDVENFPTLLIARGAEVVFFGPVLPHASAARQLVQRAGDDALPAVHDAEVSTLATRLATR